MRLLPARLARLARDFAIILVRESFFAAATGVAAAGTAAIAAIVIFAATAAAITAAATWAARTAAAGFRFRASFVNFQITSADIFAVEGGDSFGCFGIVGHFDETETARASGLAIGGDVYAGELAEGLEESAEIFRGGLKAHIPDKEVFHDDSPPSKAQPSLRRKNSANPEQSYMRAAKGKRNARCRDAKTRSRRRARTAKLKERKTHCSMIY
jgi:hypothetical protein